MLASELSTGDLKNKATLRKIRAEMEEGTGEALQGPE